MSEEKSLHEKMFDEKFIHELVMAFENEGRNCANPRWKRIAANCSDVLDHWRLKVIQSTETEDTVVIAEAECACGEKMSCNMAEAPASLRMVCPSCGSLAEAKPTVVSHNVKNTVDENEPKEEMKIVLCTAKCVCGEELSCKMDVATDASRRITCPTCGRHPTAKPLDGEEPCGG